MLKLKLNKRMSKWNTILVLSAFALSGTANATEPVKGKDCLDVEKMLNQMGAAPKVVTATTNLEILEGKDLHPRMKANALSSLVRTERNVPTSKGVHWKQNGCRSLTLTMDGGPDGQPFTAELKIYGYTPKSIKVEGFDREDMELIQTGPGSATWVYTYKFSNADTVCGQQLSGKATFRVTEKSAWGKNPKEPEASFALTEMLVSNQKYLLEQLNQNACSPAASVQPVKFLDPIHEKNNSGGSGDGYGKKTEVGTAI